jgi:predicted transcriptional regulator
MIITSNYDMLMNMIHEEIAAQLVQLGQYDEILSEQLNATRRAKMEEFQGKVSNPAKSVEVFVKHKVHHLKGVRDQNTLFLKKAIKSIGGFPTAVKVGPLACFEALRILAHSHDEKFKRKQIKEFLTLDSAHITADELNVVLRLTTPSSKKVMEVSTTMVKETRETSSRNAKSSFEIVTSRQVFDGVHQIEEAS